jgi:hypothetical protein
VNAGQSKLGHKPLRAGWTPCRSQLVRPYLVGVGGSSTRIPRAQFSAAVLSVVAWRYTVVAARGSACSLLSTSRGWGGEGGLSAPQSLWPTNTANTALIPHSPYFPCTALVRHTQAQMAAYRTLSLPGRGRAFTTLSVNGLFTVQTY